MSLITEIYGDCHIFIATENKFAQFVKINKSHTSHTSRSNNSLKNENPVIIYS